MELIRTAIDLELTEGSVIADSVGETPCVFLAGLHRAERAIADRLTRLANGTLLPWPWIDPDKALPWVEERIGLALAERQVAAIRLALMSKVLVMTGGPGVGKTTIIKAILRILAAKGVRLLLCAPTGRAAKRMTEATGFEAKTIHRLLEVDPKGGGFERGDENPLDCDLLVVDETSMVDVMLMQALMKAVPDKAALLIVGDIDQLPSVGPGQVLADGDFGWFTPYAALCGIGLCLGYALLGASWLVKKCEGDVREAAYRLLPYLSAGLAYLSDCCLYLFADRTARGDGYVGRAFVFVYIPRDWRNGGSFACVQCSIPLG